MSTNIMTPPKPDLRTVFYSARRILRMGYKSRPGGLDFQLSAAAVSIMRHLTQRWDACFPPVHYAGNTHIVYYKGRKYWRRWLPVTRTCQEFLKGDQT